MDAFSCEICELRFTESGANVPLAVPCGHTYCRACLLEWERKEKSGKSGKSVCPKCRKAFSGGVQALPNNYTLMRLISVSNGTLSSIVTALRPATTAEELLLEAERMKAVEERTRTLIEAEDTRQFFLEWTKIMKEKQVASTARMESSKKVMGELVAKRDAAIFERIAAVTLELMKDAEPAIDVVQASIQKEMEELAQIDAYLEEQQERLLQVDAKVLALNQAQ